MFPSIDLIVGRIESNPAGQKSIAAFLTVEGRNPDPGRNVFPGGLRMRPQNRVFLTLRAGELACHRSRSLHAGCLHVTINGFWSQSS